jgi:phage shock protein E
MLKICTLSLVLAALQLTAADAFAQHTKDSLDKVKENLAQKKAILIDVREPKEWNAGHLQDAQLLPLSELKQAAKGPKVQEKVDKALSKQQIIYCHCGSGVRVLAAKGILSKLGYDVRPLAAGYDDLVAAGFAPAKNQK